MQGTKFKYAKIEEKLMAFLRNENLVDGKLPPLRELAARFGVSLSTLRKAIQSLEDNGEVVTRHGSGVYVIDRRGEQIVDMELLQAVPGNITVFIIDGFIRDDFEGHLVDNFVLDEILQGAREVCREHGLGLRSLSFVLGEGEQAVLRRLTQGKERAAVLLITQHFIKYIDILESQGIPVVSIGPLGTEALKYEVSIDMFEAGATAGRYLAELGHKDVLYIGESPDVAKTSCMRHAGFSFVYKNMFPDRPLNEVLISETRSSDESRRLFGEAAQRALSYLDSVSAVFISSEQVALVVVPYLLQHGVQIPQTVSLVTLDDSRFARAFTPMWTAVSLDRYSAARMAAGLLYTWDSENRPDFYSSIIPPKLMIRESAKQFVNKKITDEELARLATQNVV